MRDLHNNIDVRPAINPYDHASGDTAVTTETCDLQGFQSVELLLSFGSIADSDVTFALVVYESDTSAMGSPTAVDDANLLGTEALAMPLFSDDNKVYKIGYTGAKRYINAIITPSNNTGAILMSGVWVLGNPGQAPTANPPANPTAL